MFGTFQQSNLRIEIRASAAQLQKVLLEPEQFRSWLWPQRFSTGLPDSLQPGLSFTSWAGPVPIQHSIELIEPNRLRMLLSQGIDGFHEWSWGDGWVQSRLEGVSLLPLNLGQTYALLRLQQVLGAIKA